MEFNRLMAEVCSILKISVAEFPVDMVTLNIEFHSGDEVCVEFVEAHQSVYLSSTVGYLPDERAQRSVLAENVLNSHRYGLQTNGAYFSLDTEGSKLLLQQNFLLQHLDSDYFYQQIERFVGAFRGWKDRYMRGELFREMEPENRVGSKERMVNGSAIFV
jgi:hypothetical protein